MGLPIGLGADTQNPYHLVPFTVSAGCGWIQVDYEALRSQRLEWYDAKTGALLGVQGASRLPLPPSGGCQGTIPPACDQVTVCDFRTATSFMCGRTELGLDSDAGPPP